MSSEPLTQIQLQQAYSALVEYIASDDFESAVAALEALLLKLEKLPQGWETADAWVVLVAEIDNYLNTLQPELESLRQETQAAIKKVGKGKKGVKAYTE